MEAWEGEAEEAKAEVATVGTVTAAVAMGLVEEEAVVTLTVEEEAAEDGFAKLCYSNQTSYFRQ